MSKIRFVDNAFFVVDGHLYAVLKKKTKKAMKPCQTVSNGPRHT